MTDRKPTQVMIKVRISFPALFTPKKQKNSTAEKYGAMFLIDKSDKETIEAVKKAIIAAKKQGIAEKWGGKVPPGYKGPLRDGDAIPDPTDDDESTSAKPVMPGHYYFNASGKDKPGVLIRKNGKNVPAAEEEVYPGCWVYITANFYPYNNEGKGVAAGLNNVLKVADGPRLDGRRSAQEDFEDLDYAELDSLDDDDLDMDDLL